MTDPQTAPGDPGTRLPPPTFFDPAFERLPAAAAWNAALTLERLLRCSRGVLIRRARAAGFLRIHPPVADTPAGRDRFPGG